MKQSEIAHVLRPAAEAALDKGMTWRQAQLALLLTMTEVAMERAHKVQKEVAAILDLSPGQISRILAGKRLPAADKKPRAPRRRRDPQVDPAQRIGAMEL